MTLPETWKRAASRRRSAEETEACYILRPRRASTSRRSAHLPELGRNLRRLRTAAGLTQNALAKRSGVNRAALSRMESGRRTPTIMTLWRLARSVSPASFFEERDSIIDPQEL